MKIKVEVVRETKKAKLVKTEDGRQGWMMNRSVNAELMVNEETFIKAAAEFAGRESAKEAAMEFRNEYHSIGEIARESDKVVAVEARIDEECTDQSITRLIWLPKSQIKDGQVQGWLLQTKVEDLLNQVRMSNGGCYTVYLCGKTF